MAGLVALALLFHGMPGYLPAADHQALGSNPLVGAVWMTVMGACEDETRAELCRIVDASSALRLHAEWVPYTYIRAVFFASNHAVARLRNTPQEHATALAVKLPDKSFLH